MDDSLQRLARYAAEGARLREEYFSAAAPLLIEAARTLALALARGRRVWIVADAESRAQAERWAEVFVHGHLVERPPLPVVALRLAEGFGFAPQIQALGRETDVLVVVGAGPFSPEMDDAVSLARERKMFTLALAGNHEHTGCHLALSVPHASLPLVREMHMALMHSLCALVDYYLFENVTALGLRV